MRALETITDARVVGPYKLWLRFADGVEGEVDLEDELSFTGVFEPLKEPNYFALGKFDPDAGTVVWPNDADIAPETLYDLVVGYCVHQPAGTDKRRTSGQ